MAQMNVDIPDALVPLFAARCEAAGKTKAQVVRELVIAYCNPPPVDLAGLVARLRARAASGGQSAQGALDRLVGLQAAFVLGESVGIPRDPNAVLAWMKEAEAALALA